VTGPTRSRRQPEEAEVGEPERTFCGNQFGNTFPLLAHHGVPLCVPEVGDPIGPGTKPESTA
jgi:hypothetical protein